jgi:hypothetical protein
MRAVPVPAAAACRAARRWLRVSLGRMDPSSMQRRTGPATVGGASVADS